MNFSSSRSECGMLRRRTSEYQWQSAPQKRSTARSRLFSSQAFRFSSVRKRFRLLCEVHLMFLFSARFLPWFRMVNDELSIEKYYEELRYALFTILHSQFTIP